MTVNRTAWGQFGNFDTDSDNYIGTNDLDVNFNIKVNSTFGGQILVAFFNPNDTVLGGPAFDLRPGEAMWLPNFVGIQTSMELVSAENAIASSITFELNNDQGGAIRRFLLATSDAGTFGNYQFILGNTANSAENQLIAGGDFDFIFQNTGTLKSFIFNLKNLAGSQVDVFEANGSGVAQPSLPFTNYKALLGVLQDQTIVYGVTPFDIISMKPTITNITTDNTVNSGVNADTVWEFDTTQVGLFSGTQAMSAVCRMKPTNFAQTHQVRGVFGQSIFEGGASATISSIQGMFGSCGVQGGEAAQCIGLLGSTLTVFLGNIVDAIGVHASAWVPFLGGTCDVSTSLVSEGGTNGVINWNARFTNDVRSYHEGNWIIGQITETDVTARLFVNGKGRITDKLIYQDKFDSGVMDMMAA